MEEESKKILARSLTFERRKELTCSSLFSGAFSGRFGSGLEAIRHPRKSIESLGRIDIDTSPPHLVTYNREINVILFCSLQKII